MDEIHVLIADDHTLFRAGLRALLKLFTDIQVAGEASSGEEAITKAEALQPDSRAALGAARVQHHARRRLPRLGSDPRLGAGRICIGEWDGWYRPRRRWVGYIIYFGNYSEGGGKGRVFVVFWVLSTQNTKKTLPSHSQPEQLPILIKKEANHERQDFSDLCQPERFDRGGG